MRLDIANALDGKCATDLTSKRLIGDELSTTVCKMNVGVETIQSTLQAFSYYRRFQSFGADR